MYKLLSGPVTIPGIILRATCNLGPRLFSIHVNGK